MNEEKAMKERLYQFHEVEDFLLGSYESSTLYKDKMKKCMKKKSIRHYFHVCDFVLLYDSHLRLFPGKYKWKWSCPFKVTRVLKNEEILYEVRMV